MEMLLSKEVEIKWCYQNKKHFEELGYKYTGNLKPFIAKIEDLTVQSHVTVEMCCDNCGKPRQIEYREYLKNYNNKPYLCDECIKEIKFKNIIIDFERKGYYVYSTIDEYQNCFSKVRYVCKKHPDKGEQSITIAEFNQDSGCRYCGAEQAGLKNRLSYEDVNNIFKARGLILLSQDYNGADDLLDFICPKHTEKGIQQIRYRAIYDGQGCKYCGHEKISKALKFDFDFIKQVFEENDLILLDKNYVDSRTPLSYICKFHPNEIQTIEFRALYNQNQGCRFCFIERNAGENSVHWKGGISDLSAYLRQFLNEWKKESFKLNNYKCCITNKKADGHFEVHHLLSVNIIIQNILNELNLPVKKQINEYSKDELERIIETFINKNNKIYGVVLHPLIHKLYHSIYGYGNNTPSQFEEFKQRYKSGEFDSILQEVS